MNEAVENAKETFRTWSRTSILQRQQIMFRYQDLVRKNMVSSKPDDPHVVDTVSVRSDAWPRTSAENRARRSLMPKVHACVVCKWLNPAHR